MLIHTIHSSILAWRIPGQGSLAGYSSQGCKELYIKQITNMDILYSTGNSTQYFVITYKGNESEKEYMTESLCCIPESNTTL